jgi:apocytochrome f
MKLFQQIKNMKSRSIQLLFFLCTFIFSTFAFSIEESSAYPVYAQQGYANPRAANGRIACANCHLAEKTTTIESPQSVLPNTVFETVVNIPYDKNAKQIQGNGKLGSLNVGAVVILPEGFKLAPNDKLTKEIKEKSKGVYISSYSPSQENILVVGPIAGDTHQEIVFPVLSPDPATNKNVHFLNYPIYVGANRGRGQIYPTGEKSNNNAILAQSAGQVANITTNDKNETIVTLLSSENKELKQTIPAGLNILVHEKDMVQADQPLTKDPNVGGFGQTETEIVLQNPLRVIGYLAFAFCVTLTQIFLVIKKKQFEKVQAAEMNF